MKEEIDSTIGNMAPNIKRPKTIWVILIIAVLLAAVLLSGIVISAYNLLWSLSLGSPSSIYVSAIITRLVMFWFLVTLIIGIWKRRAFGWYLCLLFTIAIAILPFVNYLNPGAPESQLSNFEPQNDAQALGFDIIGPAVYCAIFICIIGILCRRKI